MPEAWKALKCANKDSYVQGDPANGWSSSTWPCCQQKRRSSAYDIGLCRFVEAVSVWALIESVWVLETPGRYLAGQLKWYLMARSAKLSFVMESGSSSSCRRRRLVRKSNWQTQSKIPEATSAKLSFSMTVKSLSTCRGRIPDSGYWCTSHTWQNSCNFAFLLLWGPYYRPPADQAERKEAQARSSIHNH